jgi:ribulose-5-phosphate 4-epimerase/fuculose-1-phosphate aldolase
MSLNRYSEQEQQLRVDLAAAYRMFAQYGWDDLIFTHLSARVPGPEAHFLINPYGMFFEEITASSLVKVDLKGNAVEPTKWPVNPAGFNIHSAVHAAREDAHCVMHLHTAHGIAVSIQADGLQPLSQQSLFALANISYHDYEGVALNEDERPRLVADLANSNFMILRNHGLLTCAETVADAFLFMYILESACRIQILAQSGGNELVTIPTPILAGIQAQAQTVTRNAGGQLAWPGVLRKLDRIDPGFRD